MSLLNMNVVSRLLLTVLLLASGPALAEKLPRLVLAGPSSSVSNPLIHMVESGALADLADQVEFVNWRDPDQLRLMALNGQADVLAMPVNVAANLYNRGAKLRLLNVSTWGLLWLVSRDPGLTRMTDLRGKEVTLPFRGDMPDILFALLAEREGLDLRKDLRLRYVATPIDAMQLLLTRRTDHALLAEPAISMALRKANSGALSLVAPELHRSIDLQQEWGRLLQREARIPQAGIALMASVKDNPTIAARIEEAYAASLQWCGEHAQDCGKLVASRLTMLSAEAVSDSLAVAQMHAVPAAEARAEVEYFFDQLLEKNPALIGGKLPAADFYAAPAVP
ncbi:ABC transporter substrate-binding protein [Stutzerimonas degradans]|uniref:ABC transporter substrate-binding protein n=1 Tax=Stutzerimonas degradans TaxID=2968968 RepID=A0A8E2U227_9GAMM|nr:MqnA/MqnD/SBP family protein [Stutzerimonas degradans]MCQ4273867.1 ABC transporter substrate-binding protein [Stutzerimonas degradans]PNF77441.1 ABC transporter substrate-binding protein [Stutzerimonas degradans]QPT21010.1 ABC transporter substrate-binding protein [Stutzerimonas degradans]